MVMLDRDFQKKNYDFKFVRQEFLGEVRCIVIDVQPKGNAGGRFLGRIWVEDREYNIVRFNGTYSPRSRYSYFLHFDSWRLNLQAGLWLPSYVFIEESNFKGVGPLLPGLHFKAQTRLVELRSRAAQTQPGVLRTFRSTPSRISTDAAQGSRAG